MFEPFIAGILLLGMAVGMLYVFMTNRKTQVRASRAEAANALAAQKLEDLLNSPWSDPLHPGGMDVGNHTQGLLAWNVEDKNPRLKKITVRAFLASTAERSIAEANGTQPLGNASVSIVGYKYNDF